MASLSFIDLSCNRALQNKVNHLKAVKGTFLLVKVDVAIGECNILFIGLFLEDADIYM